MTKSIAFVSPWPPHVMGIGETCFALVSELVQISPYRFSVYTDAQNPTQIPGVSVHAIQDLEETIEALKGYDLVVHQMGNSSSHAFQRPLLEAVPAVCHFHDLNYNQFWSWYDPDLFFKELLRFYPELGKRFKITPFQIWNRLKWKWAKWTGQIDIHRCPLIEPHVEKSLGCIVHSDFNKRFIERSFPSKTIFKIHLHKGNIPLFPKGDATGRIRFGVFGSVMPNKQVDLIFKTFAKLPFSNWSLTLAGPVADSCKGLYQLAKKLGIESKIRFLGKVDKETYWKELNQIDCCINLRLPSYGESSGVVTECLILGIPSLVVDHMWYSELPVFVDKLNLNDLPNHLFSTLRQYFLHPEILENKRLLIKTYASEHFSYRNWTINYLSLLDRFLS